MTDELYNTQVLLEIEMRDRSIGRFLKDHTKGDLSETITGSYLTYNYINPLTEAIVSFLSDATTGKAGRRNSAARALAMLPPEVSAFLFIKGLLNRIPLYARENTILSVTSLAMHSAGLLHDELRIRKFEEDNQALWGKISKDFDQRELPRYKRKEYLQKVISDADEDWSLWTNTDMLHVGVKLVDLFMNTTGDIKIVSTKKGKHKTDLVVPSDGLLDACERLREQQEDVCCTWYPMVHPPVPWDAENVNRGGYLSHHVTPYPLVKSSRKNYRRLLTRLGRMGKLDTVFSAINALQDV